MQDLQARAKRLGVSTILRQTLDSKHLASKPLVKPAPGGITPAVPQLRTYAEGVIDACNRIKKDPRLKMKLAAGGTAGEAMANNIRSSLLKGD